MHHVGGRCLTGTVVHAYYTNAIAEMGDAVASEMIRRNDGACCFRAAAHPPCCHV